MHLGLDPDEIRAKHAIEYMQQQEELLERDAEIVQLGVGRAFNG